MKSIQFRKCTIEDLSILSTLAKETFVAAFGTQNTKEDMDAYVLDAFTLEKVKAELTNPYSIFYFVQEEQKIIGYLKLNIETAQSEPIDNGLEVERIYLLAAYQGKGIGQLMMDKVFEVAKNLNKMRLWLGVWGKNYGAVRFYERNGFKKFAEHDFYLGKDLQTDWLMDISLQHA